MFKNNLSYLLLFCVFFSAQNLKAKEKDIVSDTISTSALLDPIDTFNYQHGNIVLNGNIASVNVPDGFKYLDAKQAEFLLVKVWGNPPSTSLGMLIPEEQSPFTGSWAINLTYDEDGHVKDDDAKDIKYDELLKDMKEQAKEANEERKKEGYPSIEILGWASPPFYDEKEHKLHWAKRIRFGEDSIESLNYNIRVLGRKGVLVMNAIGDMTQLEEIKLSIPKILPSVNFTNGNTYGEFDSSLDKVAAYGIGGLIAGGILAKTGLLAKIGLILLKFGKIIFVGAAASIAGIVKYFKGDRGKDDAAS